MLNQTKVVGTGFKGIIAFLARRNMSYLRSKRLYLSIASLLILMLSACTSEPEVQLFKLMSVKSLSSTSIELVFNQFVGDSGKVSGNYSIEGLTVQAANTVDASVILTTSEQTDKTYTVTIGSVFNKDGVTLDPATRSRSFQGIAGLTQPTQPTQPPVSTGARLQLISVNSLGPTQLELIFNESVGSSGSNASNYSIEGLTVIQAVVQSHSGLSPSANTAVPITVIPNGSIVKLTTSTQTNRSYTVRLSNITSAAGNPLDSQTSSGTFQGKETSEPSKLELRSAQSTSPTEIKLLFSMLVGPSGNVAANYRIDGLTVLEANVDRVLVTLKTSVQADRSYVVKVSNNVKAADGSSLDDQLNSKSFAGAAPAKTSNTKVHVVNLSQSLLTGSCDKGDDRSSTARCVASGIRGELGNQMDSFDVFVPGTGAEHGSWRQFNSMNLPVPGRGYLALKYQDEAFSLSNSSQYDTSVIAGRAALIELLYALEKEFPQAKVRVFGHSKGAHIVSLVSDAKESAIGGVQFFAFAVPGRTGVDISVSPDINAAPYGTPGYIQKVTSNLVSITWLNDEVKFYTGKEFNGLMMPKIWSYPGYIWDRGTSGANPLSQRIDHHGNYGGFFIDGVGNGGNLGAGVEKEWYPYCATGNNLTLVQAASECKKKPVKFSPYFWGDEACRNKAFSMMESAGIREKHYIGYSGPRSSDCRDNVEPITATVNFDYRINIGAPFKNLCEYTLKLDFEALNFSGQPYTRKNGGYIKITDRGTDTGWQSEKVEIEIPYHMRIYLSGSMKDISPTTKWPIPDLVNCAGAFSEAYIRNLVVSFRHKGEDIDRTLIGLDEGASYLFPTKITDKDNVAWYKWDDPDDANDSWDLFYWPLDTVMIKGFTEGNRKGHFYKYVHLID